MDFFLPSPLSVFQRFLASAGKGFFFDVFEVTKEMPHKPVWDISLEEWFETWATNKDCSEREIRLARFKKQ